jgi:hypothetical protein
MQQSPICFFIIQKVSGLDFFLIFNFSFSDAIFFNNICQLMKTYAEFSSGIKLKTLQHSGIQA